MLAYERNAVETKIISAATSYAVTPELKLMLTASRQDQGHTNILHSKTKAWVLGATYALGPGKLLAGYGQKDPDNSVKTKQLSVGYEYNLSKRTYLYVDAARKKDSTNGFGVATSPGTVNHYDVGVNHSF
jgi:predicted porin